MPAASWRSRGNPDSLRVAVLRAFEAERPAALDRPVFGPAGATTPVIGGDQLAQRLPSESIYYDNPRWPDVPSQTGTGSGPASYNAFHMRAMDAHGGWVMTLSLIHI